MESELRVAVSLYQMMAETCSEKKLGLHVFEETMVGLALFSALIGFLAFHLNASIILFSILCLTGCSIIVWFVKWREVQKLEKAKMEAKSRLKDLVIKYAQSMVGLEDDDPINLVNALSAKPGERSQSLADMLRIL